MKEYRVKWKRVGSRTKYKRYASIASAGRFVVLFGPEPWLAYSKKGPDDLACCPGTPEYECACGGLTVREESEQERARMPALEYLHIEEREVGAWTCKS